MADLGNLEAALFERRDNIAIVTLNRPAALNALNTAMHRDVDACWDEINTDDEIRAAVVTGAGRFFCAGRDIKEYLQTYGDNGKEVLRPIDDPDHELFGRLCNHYIVKKPLIAALNGPAVGGGLEIVLMCDMVVMARDAYIADLHAKVNVGGMNTLLWFLPPMIARELSMTERRLSAEECLRYGIANRVVDREQVLDTAIDLAKATTAMGPDSIRLLKEGSIRLQKECGLVFDEAAIEERRRTVRKRLAQQRRDRDLLEGMKAFAERREARYDKPS
jgi:enoyl-CoA hydratase/carnithine racemase